MNKTRTAPEVPICSLSKVTTIIIGTADKISENLSMNKSTLALDRAVDCADNKVDKRNGYCETERE